MSTREALERDVNALRMVMASSLGGVMWDRAMRGQVRARMEDRYGAKAASKAVRQVSQQLTVTCVNRMVAAFERYLSGDEETLSTDEVLAALDDVKSVKMGDEATHVILQAIVHTAMQRMCAADNIEEGCREVIQLVHLGELANEAKEIADFRVRAMGHMKSLARKGLRGGPKAMARAAANYEQESPLSDVVQGLKAYAQGITDNLGPLASDYPLHGDMREAAMPHRRRDLPQPASDDSDMGEPPARRGRKARQRPRAAVDDEDDDSQLVGFAANARKPREPAADIVMSAPLDTSDDEEEETKHFRLTPIRKTNSVASPSATPKRGGRASRKATPQRQPAPDADEPSPVLPPDVQRAVDGVEKATRAMREVRGEDPLPGLLRKSRRAGRGIYSVSANARDPTPIEDSDDDSLDRPPLPTRPKHTALSRVEVNGEGDFNPTKLTPRRRGKNSFSRAEDDLLKKGLERFGWSEWARIHQVYFRAQGTGRTADSLKDRARYLEKTLRIKRVDFPPPAWRPRRTGPPSKVPSKKADELGLDDDEIESDNDEDEEEEEEAEEEEKKQKGNDDDAENEEDDKDQDEADTSAKKGTLDSSPAEDNDDIDAPENEPEENDETGPADAGEPTGKQKQAAGADDDSPPASPARTRARAAAVGDKRPRSEADEKSPNGSARKPRSAPGSSGRRRGRPRRKQRPA